MLKSAVVFLLCLNSPTEFLSELLRLFKTLKGWRITNKAQNYLVSRISHYVHTNFRWWWCITKGDQQVVFVYCRLLISSNTKHTVRESVSFCMIIDILQTAIKWTPAIFFNIWLHSSWIFYSRATFNKTFPLYKDTNQQGNKLGRKWVHTEHT